MPNNMDWEGFNKLDKLTIYAFPTVRREEERPALDSFEAIFNVEAFSRKYEHVFQGNSAAGINTSVRSAKYSYSKPSLLNFQLFFDSTGLSKSGLGLLSKPEPNTQEQIDHFLEVCYQYDGEIHQPRFLVIKWGSLAVNCRLVSVDIKYTLFDKSGNPLRAELDAAFIEDISDDQRAKLEDKKSPDIARSRIVVAGDSLPSLCREVYGSENYHLEIARYNRIDHPREIQEGMEIQFPPLDDLTQSE